MLFKRSDKHKSSSLKIGEKAVYARRIPIAQWRELFDSIQMIPQLLMSVITAAPQDRAGYFIVALRESFDDIVRVTSILTEIDEEYIEENASIDQLIAFYKATADANNFGELLKNGRSVLGTIMPNLTVEATTQDAS
ncbi:hypothetical protein [Paenibacillus alvei]|uniref:hypothetical protein n=1 Tax=Paenibacillus alvei TaxID=44250 RepID=UPI0018CFBC63|nr:hypothetical protein [Paenibacillus alvei]MBG9736297.1 hypothetical protein [Paenibacillus alvei]MBG9747166.1 hypothetical protein [Paenibacillus alvei]MCY9583070.1 hypothetical protein [Paenibacillus alvei]MCY9587342.1 hypothetical protein [Paenibacillus alvei]